MLSSIAVAAPQKLTDAQLDRITAGAGVPPPQRPCEGALSCFVPGYGRFTAFNTGKAAVNSPAPGQGASHSNYPISLGTATAGRGSPYPL
jgi:hypothetical protein